MAEPLSERQIPMVGSVLVVGGGVGGRKLEAKTIAEAAAEATRHVDVVEDINGSAEYRKHLTEVYVGRAIEGALRG